MIIVFGGVFLGFPLIILGATVGMKEGAGRGRLHTLQRKHNHIQKPGTYGLGSRV